MTAARLYVGFDRVGGAFAYLGVIEINAAHAGLGAECHKVRVELMNLPLANAVPILRQHNNAPSLGCLVGERRKLSCVSDVALALSVYRMKRNRLAIAQRRS